MGQLAADVSRLSQARSSSLPSQMEVNPQVHSLNALQAWAGIEITDELRQMEADLALVSENGDFSEKEAE